MNKWFPSSSSSLLGGFFVVFLYGRENIQFMIFLTFLIFLIQGPWPMVPSQVSHLHEVSWRGEACDALHLAVPIFGCDVM